VPQFSIHRGRLQGVIFQAVRARLGESRIHTGHRLGAFKQDEAGVSAYFFDRNGSHRRTAHGDVLIGADGIHSYVRETLYPERGPARWNGIDALARRRRLAAVPHRPLDGDRRRHGCQARGLSDRRGPRARDPPLTNWAVAGEESGEGGAPPRQRGLVAAGPLRGPDAARAALLASLYVDAKALIEATPEFWEYPMCDRDPLPRWSHGRVTLLGDAAHPMYPVGSNGASQAILDARCLADLLVGADHPVQALWQYEQERLPPTAQIVHMNRKGGPEGVIDAVEARAPDGFTDIDRCSPTRSARRSCAAMPAPRASRRAR
jgi:5-methylphenazine-1-carboxylate 1-monooxygenase